MARRKKSVRPPKVTIPRKRAEGEDRPEAVPGWLVGGRDMPAPVPTKGGARVGALGGPYPTYLPTIPRTGQTQATRAQQQYPTARFGVPMTQTAAGGPYPLYLPTITRTGGAGTAGGQPAQPSAARYFGRWGYAMPHVLSPEQIEADRALAQTGRQYTPPGPAAGVGAAVIEAGRPGGGGGAGGGGLAAAPPGVNPGWYAEFQRRHGGQTPEEFYGRTGEGLPEAMADLEWSQGFAQMYGRPPTEDDWKAHWFATRVGRQPGEGTMGGMTPRQYERWQRARKERRRAKKAEKEGTNEPRPPTWMPPQIIWR